VPRYIAVPRLEKVQDATSWESALAADITALENQEILQRNQQKIYDLLVKLLELNTDNEVNYE